MRTILILASVVMANLLFGQQDYILTLEKDTLYGRVSIEPNTYYDEVVISNDEGKYRLKVYQVIHVKFDGDIYDPIIFRNKKVFGKRLVRGALSHYMVRSEDNSVYFDEIFLKKNGESLVISSLGFKKRTAAFLSDCEVVSEKITNRELKYSNRSTIVEAYNERCTDQE